MDVEERGRPEQGRTFVSILFDNTKPDGNTDEEDDLEDYIITTKTKEETTKFLGSANRWDAETKEEFAGFLSELKSSGPETLTNGDPWPRLRLLFGQNFEPYFSSIDLKDVSGIHPSNLGNFDVILYLKTSVYL
jgi:hypothetical protein